LVLTDWTGSTIIKNFVSTIRLENTDCAEVPHLSLSVTVDVSG